MDAPSVTLTESAARRINKIVAGEDRAKVLRVTVEGGGCSGFQYRFDLDDTVNADDVIVERDGARVAIDQMSLPFLTGSKIDFVDDLIGASFQIDNPNATASCGCGTSFSI